MGGQDPLPWSGYPLPSHLWVSLPGYTPHPGSVPCSGLSRTLAPRLLRVIELVGPQSGGTHMGSKTAMVWSTAIEAIPPLVASRRNQPPGLKTVLSEETHPPPLNPRSHSWATMGAPTPIAPLCFTIHLGVLVLGSGAGSLSAGCSTTMFCPLVFQKDLMSKAGILDIHGLVRSGDQCQASGDWKQKPDLS